ncbi:Fic family protein [bacterium]|nr:Fic family protein [bacterium]
MTNLPEPLIDFSPAAQQLEQRLQALDRAWQRFEAELQAGKVARNSLEAMRVELTYNSNAIEGNTLSLRETQLVLEGISPPGGKNLKEIYVARNHDTAFGKVETWIAERPPHDALTLQDLLDIHKIVMRDIDPAAGGLRTGRVLIKGTRFVPPGGHPFDELIPAMLDLANRTRGLHPAIQAAELHYNFVAIHPFSDGNGRTARLLMNYWLMQRRFPVTIIDVADRAEYLNTLELANKGDCVPFASFVANCIEHSIHRLIGE